MKYCPSCGTKIRKDSSYCPSCGERIEMELKPKQKNLGKSSIKSGRRSVPGFILGFLLVLIGGYFINKKLLTNQPNYYPQEIISEVTGAYTDRHGIITNVEGNEIRVTTWREGIKGSSPEGNLTFHLDLIGKYIFEGEGILKGIKTNYQVTYDPKTQRLHFQRENSPLDWYIEKNE